MIKVFQHKNRSENVCRAQWQPDQTYSMSGNRISVKTLDLNRSFPEIEEQLKGIVKDKIA